MRIKLNNGDRFRVVADHKENNFIDVGVVGYESLAIDLFASFHYIEVRKKDQQVRVFTFPKKSYKKECDFGWWADAEVILAINEQTTHK